VAAWMRQCLTSVYTWPGRRGLGTPVYGDQLLELSIGEGPPLLLHKSLDSRGACGKRRRFSGRLAENWWGEVPVHARDPVLQPASS
jgi:hypothetical protein